MQVFHYSTPTTPAGPGSDTIISGSIEVSSDHSFTESAALGEAPIVNVSVDDPAAAYDFAGLKRWYVVEDQCPAGDQLIWNGYINDQHVTRGDGDALFPVGSGRRWQLEVEETNAILGFRIVSDVDGNRPAENASERLSWLMNSSDYLTTVGDNGLVNWDGLAGFDMDANDYRGQTAQDVLSDISVQSGYLFFAFYDKDADDDQRISLFFDDPDSTTYTSSIQISNFADADGTTICAPYEDAELHRSPSRVAAGVYLPYSGGAVYEYDLTTSYAFGFRDRLAPMATVKTAAKATALADKFLQDNNEQTDFITCKIRMAAAHLNDVKRGQVLQARFQHFPTPYNSLFYARVTRKTWAPPENRTQAFYDVELELSPISPTIAPSGAFDASVYGIKAAVPLLPTETVPGNVLLLAIYNVGGVAQEPADVRMKDGPNYPPLGHGATWDIPPFPDHAGWTVLNMLTDIDFASMNIGGPGDGVFGDNPPGNVIAWAWRYVQPGEVTKYPVAVSGTEEHNGQGAWLWQLPASAVPTAVTTTGPTHKAGNGTGWAFPSETGNIVGMFAFPQVNYGNPPYTILPSAGVTTVQSCSKANVPTLSPTHVDDSSLHGWSPGWIYIGQMRTGGILGLTFTPITAYTSSNGGGLLISLPSDVILPTIPYPTNQVLGS